MAKPPLKTKPPSNQAQQPAAKQPQGQLANSAQAAQSGQQAQGNTGGVQIHHAAFHGPMPPPSLLLGYENIVPGAAERILRMAEEDSKHMREMDKAALDAAAREVKRGQIFGLLIGLAALGASMLAIAMGAPTVAGVIGGTTVVGLVSVFIVGRVVRAKEDE